MVDRPDRTCIPLELELLPLHREPPGLAQLHRKQKREERARKRAARKTLRRGATADG